MGCQCDLASMSKINLRPRTKKDYSKMAGGESTEEEFGYQVDGANINNNNNNSSRSDIQNKNNASDDHDGGDGDIFGREIFHHESDCNDNDGDDSSNDSDKEVSQIEV